MSKKTMYEALITIVENSDSDYETKNDCLDFIKHEIELLDTRSSHKTPTKTQRENVAIKEEILNALKEQDGPINVTALIAMNNWQEKYSSQKISALLKQLVSEGSVIRTVEKRTALFALA